MSMLLSSPDVVVLGGGFAALCAAIAARLAGVRVLMAEAAPFEERGGNTRHSRNFRIRHEAPSPLFPARYSRAEFIAEVEAAAEGLGDAELIGLLVERSAEAPAWLAAQGVRFETIERGALPWSRRTAFFLGGGKTALNALYGRARALGVDIRYGCEAVSLDLSGTVELVPRGDEIVRYRPKAAIAACGGYQANREWLRREWGNGADHFINRGTPYARGLVLRSLLDHGAAPVGREGAGHLVAVDARSPEYDGGIVTRADAISWGIVVGRDGRRIADEGGDTSPTRYAAWGRRVTARSDRLAYAILDQAALVRAPVSVFPPIRADDLPSLAERLGVDPAALLETVATFNAAVVTGADRTEGLDPPKSRRAAPLTEPPFAAYPIRPGLTFTGLGVAVDETARIRHRDGGICPSVFAAGMIMAPNVLGCGYLAGAAMTIGAVFGRLAGEEAARHVRG